MPHPPLLWFFRVCQQGFGALSSWSATGIRSRVPITVVCSGAISIEAVNGARIVLVSQHVIRCTRRMLKDSPRSIEYAQRADNCADEPNIPRAGQAVVQASVSVVDLYPLGGGRGGSSSVAGYASRTTEAVRCSVARPMPIAAAAAMQTWITYLARTPPLRGAEQLLGGSEGPLVLPAVQTRSPNLASTPEV